MEVDVGVVSEYVKHGEEVNIEEEWADHRALGDTVCYGAGGGRVCVNLDRGRAVGNVGGEPVKGNASDADSGESVYEDIVVKGVGSGGHVEKDEYGATVVVKAREYYRPYIRIIIYLYYTELLSIFT